MMFARLIFMTTLITSTMAFAQPAPKIDVAQNGESYSIRVEAVLSSAPRHVWAALTDCDRARDFVPHLESCRVIERDPAGRWDIRENIANPPFLPRVRTVLRNEYTPISGFTYRLISGDMRVSEGSWSVQPAGNATRIVYQARVEPSVSVPGFLVISAIKADLPGMISKLAALSQTLANRSN